MKGLRKFLLGLGGIISFTLIMINNPNTNPFYLGLGIGAVISPAAIANIAEHLSLNNLFKKQK